MSRYLWIVEVRSCDGWTIHSTHKRLQDAQDQCDLVHGRLVKFDGQLDELTLASIEPMDPERFDGLS
jgi:hypothetical protein